MTIHELREKINPIAELVNSREFYTILLILLVGFGSFGLGRLSKLRESHVPIKVEQAFSAAALYPPPFQGGDKGVVVTLPQSSPSKGEEVLSLARGGKIVASKGGTKYHFPWCQGAQRISDANKIWFNSVEEARKAGYTPASNCKGLK